MADPTPPERAVAGRADAEEAERVYTRRVKALRATVARLEHDAALVRLASDEAALRDLRAWLTYRADNLTPPGSGAPLKFPTTDEESGALPPTPASGETGGART